MLKLRKWKTKTIHKTCCLYIVGKINYEQKKSLYDKNMNSKMR